MPLLEGEEEKKLILKSAKMRLDKVEERLRTIRSKQLIAKQNAPDECEDTVIENHPSKKSTRRAEDRHPSGTVNKRKSLASIDNELFSASYNDCIKASKTSNMDIMHSDVNGKQETYSNDMSESAIKKAKSLLSKLASYNISGGQGDYQQEDHTEIYMSGLDSLGRDSEEAGHFSKMQFIPKVDQIGELADVDKWRSKKLSHDLEKLFVNVYDRDVKQVSVSVSPETQFGSLECEHAIEADCDKVEDYTVGTSWHLECLSVETQWDSQFVDSMQVKRVHMEAVKDWRRLRPLELLMSGCSKDLTTDISSISLPCMVNDVIVCNMWKELKKDLSLQIGENYELTGVVADSMLLKFSEDLDVLTETNTDIEQSHLSHSYKDLLNAKKYLEQELGLIRVSAPSEKSTLASQNSLLSQMEEQLENIRVNMSSRKCSTDCEPNEFRVLSFTQDYCQKPDQTWDLFGNENEKHSIFPWNVMLRSNTKLTESEVVTNIDDVCDSAMLHGVKRKYGDSSDNYAEDYELARKKRDAVKVESDVGVSYGSLDDYHSREKSHSKNKKKRKSSKIKHSKERISDEIKFDQSSNQNCSGGLEAKDEKQTVINKNVQEEKCFYQQTQLFMDTDLQDSAEFMLVTKKPELFQADFASDSLTVNDKLQIMIAGSATEFQICMKSLFIDKLGPDSVNLAANGLDFSSALPIDSESLSLIPLRIPSFNPQDERYVQQKFKCFDELCSNEIIGGELIIRSSRFDDKSKYGKAKPKNSESPKRSALDSLQASYSTKNKRHEERSNRKSNSRISRSTDRRVSSEKVHLKVGTDKRPSKHGTSRLHTDSPVSPPSIRKRSNSPHEVVSDSVSVIPILSKHKPTAQQCPRFMQTFRQSQIAKRKSQREAPSSVFACSLFASSIPLPADLPLLNATSKDEDIVGVQGLAVSTDMTLQNGNIEVERTVEPKNAPVLQRTSTAGNVKSVYVPPQNGQSDPAHSSVVDVQTTAKVTITTNVSGSSLPVMEHHLPMVGVKNTENIGHAIASNIVASSCPVRIFVFNKEKKECQLAEAAMTCCGARTFDPYNVVLLRAIIPLECLVLVNSSDLSELHRIPNLLRLKRDLRISFVSYNNVEDVLSRNFKVVYPRAGLVVMDTGTLIHCNPDHLEKMCQYMQKQATEKGITWRLMISPDVANILNKHRCEISKTEQQLAQLADVIARYCSVGFIDLLPGELFKRSKMSAFDYQHCCVELQKIHFLNYRHFLFVTDALKQFVDIKGFTESGIDVMSIPDFLRGFVGSGSVTQSKMCKEYTTAISTEALAAYIDSATSSASEILLNKWNVPFTAGKAT